MKAQKEKKSKRKREKLGVKLTFLKNKLVNLNKQNIKKAKDKNPTLKKIIVLIYCPATLS